MTEPEPQISLRLKELEYLRKEIEYRTLDQAIVERNVVVAISAIYVAHDYGVGFAASQSTTVCRL